MASARATALRLTGSGTVSSSSRFGAPINPASIIGGMASGSLIVFGAFALFLAATGAGVAAGVSPLSSAIKSSALGVGVFMGIGIFLLDSTSRVESECSRCDGKVSREKFWKFWKFFGRGKFCALTREQGPASLRAMAPSTLGVHPYGSTPGGSAFRFSLPYTLGRLTGRAGRIGRAAVPSRRDPARRGGRPRGYRIRNGARCLTNGPRDVLHEMSYTVGAPIVGICKTVYKMGSHRPVRICLYPISYSMVIREYRYNTPHNTAFPL